MCDLSSKDNLSESQEVPCGLLQFSETKLFTLPYNTWYGLN